MQSLLLLPMLRIKPIRFLLQSIYRLRRLGRFLGKQDRVDVWKHTATGNRHTAQQSVQFFVILDRQRNVAWHNTTLFVVASGVAGQLENFRTQVLEDGCQIDRRSSTHTGGVLALTEVTADTTDGELQACLGRGGGRLFVAASSLSC